MGYETQFRLTVLDNTQSRLITTAFTNMREMAARRDAMTDEAVGRYNPAYLSILDVALESWLKVSQCMNRDIFEMLLVPDRNNAGMYRWTDAMKWYDHVEDMMALSRAFPDFIFQLEGAGEESRDVWVKWYQGGRVQGGRAVFTLPEFSDRAWRSS